MLDALESFAQHHCQPLAHELLQRCFPRVNRKGAAAFPTLTKELRRGVLLCISILVSSDEENGQSSWQSSQVKMFVQSGWFGGFSWYAGRYPKTWCTGRPTSKVRYLAHGSTCRPNYRISWPRGQNTYQVTLFSSRWCFRNKKDRGIARLCGKVGVPAAS